MIVRLIFLVIRLIGFSLNPCLTYAQEDEANTSLGALFFDPFRDTKLAELQKSDLTQSQIDEAMKSALSEYVSCFVDAIWEWDDPISDFYNSDIVLGLPYDQVGIRREGVSQEEHAAWLARVKELAPSCEERAAAKPSP